MKVYIKNDRTHPETDMLVAQAVYGEIEHMQINIRHDVKTLAVDPAAVKAVMRVVDRHVSTWVSAWSKIEVEAWEKLKAESPSVAARYMTPSTASTFPRRPIDGVDEVKG